ncbi:hypothetical protein J4463_01085 [Candidatus Pacearchaeota archaeon]|nr:hypothetical protein [Candidatus Pacearchaeota archaeon]
MREIKFDSDKMKKGKFKFGNGEISKKDRGDKKAILLPEALKIIIALACLVLLGYLAVDLYSLFASANQKQQVKVHLDNLIELSNTIKDGESKEYVLIYPKGWALTSWPAKGYIETHPPTRVGNEYISGDIEQIPYGEEDVPAICKQSNWKRCICFCEWSNSKNYLLWCEGENTICDSAEGKEIFVNPQLDDKFRDGYRNYLVIADLVDMKTSVVLSAKDNQITIKPSGKPAKIE